MIFLFCVVGSSDNEPRSISSDGDRASSLASTSTGDNVSNDPSEGMLLIFM